MESVRRKNSFEHDGRIEAGRTANALRTFELLLINMSLGHLLALIGSAVEKPNEVQ
jgi:hypothetical protein